MACRLLSPNILNISCRFSWQLRLIPLANSIPKNQQRMNVCVVVFFVCVCVFFNSALRPFQDYFSSYETGVCKLK